MPSFRFIPILALLLIPFAAPAQEDSVFGSRIPSEKALIGILYDLKQNQKREPTGMTLVGYNNLVDEFLSKGWDESVLNRFYRVTRPLYTTQIHIPLIPAAAAPKAFGVEKIVKPSFWMIHYKGQVSAPTSGTWRFWGYGEEVCSVAINSENVLLSNWKEITCPTVGWKSPEPPGQPAANGYIKAGTWFDLKAGEVVDLDVIIGERGGGVFCAFLLIEQKGAKYEQHNGHPVLPVFQLAPFNTSPAKSVKEGPVIAKSGPIWNGTP